MNRMIFFVVCTFLICLGSCEKKEGDDSYGLEVDNYISLLKLGEYDSMELPEFSELHIPALLEYRHERHLISNFPVNMISSYFMKECALGIYVLWTVESIRSRKIESDSQFGSFPSQNPMVILRNAPFEIRDADEDHRIIANAYYIWWQTSKHKRFDRICKIDPLSSTPYRWH